MELAPHPPEETLRNGELDERQGDVNGLFSKNMMTGGTHLGWAESENGAAEKMDVHDASKLQIQRTTNRVTKGPKSHGQSIAFLFILSSCGRVIREHTLLSISIGTDCSSIK